MTTILFDAMRYVNATLGTFGAGLAAPDRPARSAIYWDARRGEWVDPISAADRAWWAAESARLEEAAELAALEAEAADALTSAEYDRFAALGYLPI